MIFNQLIFVYGIQHINWNLQLVYRHNKMGSVILIHIQKISLLGPLQRILDFQEQLNSNVF